MTIFRDSPQWGFGDTDVFLYRGGEWKCATYSGNSLGFRCGEVWLPSQLSSFIHGGSAEEKPGFLQGVGLRLPPRAQSCLSAQILTIIVCDHSVFLISAQSHHVPSQAWRNSSSTCGIAPHSANPSAHYRRRNDHITPINVSHIFIW